MVLLTLMFILAEMLEVVGTAEGEDQFFKAAIATGNEFNEKITLFYDSPEQFENHHMQFLDEPIKEAWRKRVGIM